MTGEAIRHPEPVVEIGELLKGWSERAENLIPILQEIQQRYRYLPEAALRAVAARLQVPLPEVFHVATFYNCFSLEPVGEHLIQVCMGTACHVRGAPLVLERFLRELKLPRPGTTPDLQFTVRTVRCIGCCGLAPVARVDDQTYAHLTQARADSVLRRYRRTRSSPKPSSEAAEKQT
ncbi:MAG: NAD(P)H-dependent oxidoreductase subunit E [Acidobacteriia bacterium]|nr:NAD(P)H-dependent oxidoreductase subunit E [Terriglobia bacterium]